MSISRKLLCISYGLVGLLALIGTWGNNLAYSDLGFLGATKHFWQETRANPASRSITVDILFLTLAVAIWMLLEARRLRMGWVWLYIIFGILIAISFTFPAFLIHREYALTASDSSSSAGHLSPLDIAGLLLLTIASAGYAILTLA